MRDTPIPNVPTAAFSQKVAVVMDGFTFRTRLPTTEQQMAKGYMGVEAQDIAADECMLFEYRAPAPRVFTMRNCKSPLWIAFVAPNGKVAKAVFAMPGTPYVRHTEPCARVVEFGPNTQAKPKVGSTVSLLQK
tara:strand:- start:891 stop:1289 length:399 start_codon:yes stop_codon:yes gene_type:complete